MTMPDTAGLLTLPNAGGGGTTLDDDLLQWLVNVHPTMTATNTNWDNVQVGMSVVYSSYRLSTGAQNASVQFDVLLAAGTYTFEMIHRTTIVHGIYSVRLDGVEKGTIDGYSGSTVEGVRTQITGIAVASTGKKTLSLVMATKNGSSSGYYGQIAHLQFKRTA